MKNHKNVQNENKTAKYQRTNWPTAGPHEKNCQEKSTDQSAWKNGRWRVQSSNKENGATLSCLGVSLGVQCKEQKWRFLSRARTKAGAQIKSWRAWVLWVDGDWTCETMKSFNAEQRKQIETRIEKGSDIWPWPEGNSPKDNYRRNELKGRNMVCPGRNPEILNGSYDMVKV